MQSIDEAILICESATISTHLPLRLTLSTTDTAMRHKDASRINEMYRLIIKKLEAALLLNPTNFSTLYLLFVTARNGEIFIREGKYDLPLEFYRLRLFDYLFKLLDHPTVSGPYEVIRIESYHELARVFYEYHNYAASLMYAKLAYERCLRSSHQTDLLAYKSAYLKSKASFVGLPPLRFAVGDEVEFLHGRETGSEWRLGKVAELYYRERNFAVYFSAPYRLQLLNDSDSADPPVYAWVKADIDRYIRKVGVKSIEDTRYQAKLEIKVAELARVYCEKEVMQAAHRTLAQDHEFVDLLQSVWQIRLTESVININHMFVLYRQPLVRIDSGYHVHSTEEVIAEIRAYFDPTRISDAAPSVVKDEATYSQQIRHIIFSVLRFTPTTGKIDISEDMNNVQGLLLNSIMGCMQLKMSHLNPFGSLFRDA